MPLITADILGPNPRGYLKQLTLDGVDVFSRNSYSACGWAVFLSLFVEDDQVLLFDALARAKVAQTRSHGERIIARIQRSLDLLTPAERREAMQGYCERCWEQRGNQVCLCS